MVIRGKPGQQSASYSQGDQPEKKKSVMYPKARGPGAMPQQELGGNVLRSGVQGHGPGGGPGGKALGKILRFSSYDVL